MKKFIILFIVLSTTIASAEIIRVNNNNGISADYSSIQQAINSAHDGDQIYLDPLIQIKFLLVIYLNPVRFTESIYGKQ